MDPSLAIVIATSITAAIYLALAVSNFSRGRTGLGAARLFAAIVFSGAALFLAFYVGLF